MCRPEYASSTSFNVSRVSAASVSNRAPSIMQSTKCAIAPWYDAA
jgi:hypothetical protein